MNVYLEGEQRNGSLNVWKQMEGGQVVEIGKYIESHTHEQYSFIMSNIF